MPLLKNTPMKSSLVMEKFIIKSININRNTMLAFKKGGGQNSQIIRPSIFDSFQTILTSMKHLMLCCLFLVFGPG
jgi:hypothetical protein